MSMKSPRVVLLKGKELREKSNEHLQPRVLLVCRGARLKKKDDMCAWNSVGIASIVHEVD